jgi:hypothetical protein
MQRLNTVGASVGIEDEANYPGPIARIADDGQSMVMYLEPRANEWLCHTLGIGVLLRIWVSVWSHVVVCG